MAKKTSRLVAKMAARTLVSNTATKIQKSIAGSILSQSKTNKVTSERIERMASNALKRKSSSALTKKLAGSAMSQSTKKRGER